MSTRVPVDDWRDPLAYKEAVESVKNIQIPRSIAGVVGAVASAVILAATLISFLLLESQFSKVDDRPFVFGARGCLRVSLRGCGCTFCSHFRPLVLC